MIKKSGIDEETNSLMTQTIAIENNNNNNIITDRTDDQQQ